MSQGQDSLLMAEILTFAGVIVVLAVVGVLIYRRWSRAVPRQFRSLVQTISTEALVNVAIPDGLYGEIHLDHLLLTPSGLLLLDFKEIGGTVFAGDNLDEWSAMSAASRVTFDNPIPMLSDRVAALKLLVPGVPITAKVVFTADVEFPKGHPAAVTTLEDLRTHHALDASASGAEFASAWEQVKGAARAL